MAIEYLEVNMICLSMASLKDPIGKLPSSL